jgi:SNF2 family DNA or RNA helicase
VTSYETLIRDEALLDAVNWNVVVLDEAQAIKSPSAQRTLAAKRLDRRVSIAVTGTPVENRLEDLWSLSDFALPGLLGDLSVFRGRFEDTVSDARQLGLLVSPAILRRRVADVAIDLPELIEIPQPLELPAGLTSMYEDIRTGGAGAEPGHQLAILTRLRQFCADPSLVTSDEKVLREESPKSIRLMELAEEIFDSSEKCLVFAGFTEAIDLICERLAEACPHAFVRSIDGRTPVDVRQTIVDDFTSFTGPAALVMNPRAAGVGLNITAANHVVHFTPEWNPALTSQASARAYRMKQTKPVTVHHMFFVDTVEEAMIDRAEFKRDLAAGAVVGHDGHIGQTELVEALSRSPLNRAKST